MTVLVVEDEPMLLDILVEELELEGFRTLCATTGDRANFLLATESIGVLFTDIMMPGTVDGWDVAEYVRTVRPDFPVVYASGWNEGRGRALSGSAYLSKPYSFVDVLTAIRGVAGISNQR